MIARVANVTRASEFFFERFDQVDEIDVQLAWNLRIEKAPRSRACSRGRKRIIDLVGSTSPRPVRRQQMRRANQARHAVAAHIDLRPSDRA